MNSAVLAGVVAAICYAMMRVDGADLFPAAPEAVQVVIVPGQSAAADDAHDQKLVDA